MYKKTSFFACLFFVTCSLSPATSWFELKPSYFIFSKSPMKHIYNHGGFQIQASVSIPFYKQVDFYSSVGYRKLHGHALNTGERTSFIVVPIDLGVKPVFIFGEHFSYFFTIGPRFFYFRQHNTSTYVTPVARGGNVGLFVNTGINILVSDYFFLGLFGEGSYEKQSITSTRLATYSNGSVQMGGFAFGISFGYEF